MKTVLVTGASRGIGKSTAEYFAAHGWRVYAAVRDLRGVRFEDPAVHVIQMDVDSIGSIHRAFHLLKDKLDVVVNNAGFGAFGPFESYSDADFEKQFTTNVLGVLRVTKAALPVLNAHGVIVNVSSVAGRIGLPYFSIYSGSKFAVEGISEALYYELSSKNVHVKLVEPGPVKSDFFKQQKTTGKIAASYEKAFREGDDPLVIAKLIFEAATDGKDKLYYQPPKAKAAIRAKKLLPSNWLARRYKGRL